MDLGLAGRTILVTGGASGLGRAVATLALAEGMRVAVLDRQAPADFADGAVVHRLVDVTDQSAVEEAISQIEQQIGPLDAVVACVGVAPTGPSGDLSVEAWSQCIAINLTGAFLTAQSAGRRMVERGSGSIVLIGSSMSFGGRAGRAAYASSKHGVIGLTRTLAIEWASQSVRVNAVAPGPIDTPLIRGNHTDESAWQRLMSRIPMKRASTPEEQAAACLFLCSDAASYITGATLAVDGGLTAGHLTDE